MTGSRNATTIGNWEEPEATTWDDDGSYYADDGSVAEAAPRQGFLRRIWSGRPMIYLLAAGLVGVTALVLVTRPGAEPAPAAPAATPAAYAPITYDAGPVIDAEMMKP